MLPLDDILHEVVNKYPRIRRALSVKARAYFEGAAYKTYTYYNRSIVGFVGSLFTDKISVDEFERVMRNLIFNQLFAAWREGMAENGLDPKKDMTKEMVKIVSDIASDEEKALPGFASDIIAARTTGSADAILARAGLWSNRYNDVVNEAKLFTAPAGQMFEWIYGDTEHCDTCAALNGTVASAVDWESSGYKPQSPPNDKLDCGGWRCRCKLTPTDKKPTPGGIG